MRFDRRLLASRVQAMDPDELLFIVGVPRKNSFRISLCSFSAL